MSSFSHLKKLSQSRQRGSEDAFKSDSTFLTRSDMDFPIEQPMEPKMTNEKKIKKREKFFASALSSAAAGWAGWGGSKGAPWLMLSRRPVLASAA